VEIVDALAHRLNLDPVEAQALAGGVLGILHDTLRAHHGEHAAERFRAAVPELAAWRQAADLRAGSDAPRRPRAPGGGLLAAPPAAPGEPGAGRSTVRAAVGVSSSNPREVLDPIGQFLAQRLDAPLLEPVRCILFELDTQDDPPGGLGALGGAME